MDFFWCLFPFLSYDLVFAAFLLFTSLHTPLIIGIPGAVVASETGMGSLVGGVVDWKGWVSERIEGRGYSSCLFFVCWPGPSLLMLFIFPVYFLSFTVELWTADFFSR